MLPIYNELLKFWRDLGQEVDIQEGYYWLEKGFIKAFDKSGELQQGCPAFLVMQTVVFEVTDLLACHLGIIKYHFQVLL